MEGVGKGFSGVLRKGLLLELEGFYFLFRMKALNLCAVSVSVSDADVMR